MARRRISSSQFRSKIRQAQSKLRQAAAKQRQAVNKLNQAIRKYNQDRQRAISQYNQAVRAHNSRVRANQARIRSARAKLQSRAVAPRFTSLHTSSVRLSQVYNRLETRWEHEGVPEGHEWLAALTETETANSLDALTVALGDTPEYPVEESLEETAITGELREIEDELDDRWKGALFALNPRNPDAARHFCTSTREIFDRILVSRAPDDQIMSEMPDCALTPNGSPSRRSRIRFLLERRQLVDPDLEEFVDQDIQDILELFQLFNRGAHGVAGNFKMPELLSLKARAEDGLLFLCKVASITGL